MKESKKRKRLAAKIITVLCCISIVITLTIVPCFADSYAPVISSDEDYYNVFVEMDWEGVSLNTSDYSLLEEQIYDVDKFVVDNVFAHFLDEYNYTTIYSSQGVNPPEVLNLHGARHGKMLTGIYNYLGNFSVFNQFVIPELTYYDGNVRSDYLKQYIQCEYIVPTDLAEMIIDGSADAVIELKYHFTLDAYTYDGEEAVWGSLSNSVKFGNKSPGTIPSEYSLTDLNPRVSNINSSAPNGFTVLLIDLPTEQILDYYNFYYTGVYNDGIMFKNLHIWQEFSIIDYDIYDTILGEIFLAYGDSDFLNAYTTITFGEAFPGHVYTDLPMMSISSSRHSEDVNPVDRALEIYSQITGTVVPVHIDGNLVSWLGNTLGGVLDTPLIGPISLGSILYVCIGAGFLVLLLKFFAGG